MRRRPAHRLAPEESHSSRIAWWAAFVATIALIALLNFVRSAEAVTPAASAAGPPSTPALSAFEPEEETEEEGESGEVEECEEVAPGEFECASGEDEESAPPTCKLTHTSASAVVSPGGRLRLTIHYIAIAPVTVAVDSVLRGSRGSLKIDGERRRFAGSASFHETELLGPGQSAKAMAGRTLMVTVKPLGAPGFCHSYLDQRLDASRAGAHGPLRFS